jgi:hypothetical protein
MIETYLEMLQLVGINPAVLSDFEILQIAGRIIHDPEMRRRKSQMARGSGSSILPFDADEQILQSMPDADKAALHARVK